MGLPIGKGERRTPRAAEHEPALDSEMFAQPFDVFHEMPRRIVDETRVRTALAAAPLVEKHDPIALRIEEASHFRVRAAARAAVQKHRWLAARIAAFLEIDFMDVRDAQEPCAIRLY